GVPRMGGLYARMTSRMTAGRHHAGRLGPARAAIAARRGAVLDLATGTADLALALRTLAPERLVVGADFSEGMLHHGRAKVMAASVRRLPLLAADALPLPFPDGAFGCGLAAFLLRERGDLGRGVGEVRPVTPPRGRL